MLQRYGVIFVHKTLTATMNTAYAGILKSVDIQDVCARTITMLVVTKHAYHVSQHLEIINVAVWI